MSPIVKKLISLFLVFSLIMLSVNLYAKERRGANLIITKKDRQQIQGELITVKPNSLLLLYAETYDRSVNIEDIEVIRIVKKGKAGGGAVIGLVIGGGIGILIGTSSFPSDEYGGGEGILIGILAGVGGALLGGLAGAGTGIDIELKVGDEHIERQGIVITYDSKSIVEKLREYAHVREYK